MPIQPITLPVRDDIGIDNAEVVTADKLRVLITRVAASEDADATQLSVFINTEDMDVDHYGGTPEMQVCLNDASLYDCEPGTAGVDRVETVESLSRRPAKALVETANNVLAALRIRVEADEDPHPDTDDQETPLSVLDEALDIYDRAAQMITEAS